MAEKEIKCDNDSPADSVIIPLVRKNALTKEKKHHPCLPAYRSESSRRACTSAPKLAKPDSSRNRVQDFGSTYKPEIAEIGRDLCRVKNGGYRMNFIIEEMTEKLKAVLICENCEGIMKEACISSKGEQLCSGCDKGDRDSKQIPNRAVREMIDSLNCSCPLYTRKCLWLGALGNCENHLDTCGYVYEACKLGCGELLKREELVIHEDENCPQRFVKCDHCNEKIKSCELDGHLKKCTKMKVPCDLCGTKMTREDLELHLRYHCGMVQGMCKLGCGVILTRDELRIHEKENCPKRFVKCDHCNTKIKSCELNSHYDVCPKMEVSCDLVGCDKKITREEMKLHLKYDCGMVQETCKLGCGEELTRNKLRIHEKENCPQRKIRCEYCFIEVLFCDKSKHLKECPEMKVLCDLCSVEKYRKDMTQHLEDDCPEKMLDCPFVKYKCLARMKRKDIAKHLEEKETKHLGLKITAMEDLINEQSEINKKQSEEIKKQSKKINQQSEIISNQSNEFNKQREEINKLNEEITEQREEINKLNGNIEKHDKEMTTERSNTSQHNELLYSIANITEIIWKIEDVINLIKPYHYPKQCVAEVAGYSFILKFDNFRRLSIVFPGTTKKPDRPFIAKCHIVLHSCHKMNCGIIEVKQKEVLRGYERLITFISQEDIEKHSELQFPGATKKDLTLEIFITMQ